MERLKRIKTGVPGLDKLVEGGIIAIHDTTSCMRYSISPYHFFIKKYRVMGWPGAKKVAEQFIFRSGKFRNIGTVDTITYGTKCMILSRNDRIRTRLVRLKKYVPDTLHELIFFVSGLLNIRGKE